MPWRTLMLAIDRCEARLLVDGADVEATQALLCFREAERLRLGEAPDLTLYGDMAHE